MRVVQIIDSLVAGGKERQFCELARGLAERPGVDVEVVVLSDVIQYAALEGVPVPIHTIARNHGGASLSDFLRVRRLLQSLKPDVVHSWNSMCSVYAGPAAWLGGAAFVNGAFRNAEAKQSPGMRLRTLLTLPFSDVAVANSRAGAAAYKLPARKSASIHNGFDGSRLAALPPAAEVRRSLGIDTPFAVGMVAGFRPDKDYRTFLQMATALTRRRDDVTVVAVGDGPERESLQREFPSAGFPRIRFLGHRTDVEAISSIFSVGVLTSFNEGISNAVMEYMALGKPVVVSDIPGNRELVDEGRSGFLVPANDAETLESRISELLDNADLAERFGAAGHETIGRDFSFPAMIDAYLSLYRNVLARRAAGKPGLPQELRRTVGL